MLYSDNGSTFVGAERLIPDLMNSEEWNGVMRSKGITFKRILVRPSSRRLLGSNGETC